MKYYRERVEDWKESLIVQIKRVIGTMITGSHDSRNVMFMERAGGASSWLGPELASPPEFSADEQMANMQEGTSQASSDGGPPSFSETTTI